MYNTPIECLTELNNCQPSNIKNYKIISVIKKVDNQTKNIEFCSWIFCYVISLNSYQKKLIFVLDSSFTKKTLYFGQLSSINGCNSPGNFIECKTFANRSRRLSKPYI